MSHIVRTMPFTVDKKDLIVYFRRREQKSISITTVVAIVFGLLFVVFGVVIMDPAAAFVGVLLGGSLAAATRSRPSSLATRVLSSHRSNWIYLSKMSVQSEDGDLVLLHEDGTKLVLPRSSFDLPEKIDDLYVFKRGANLLAIVPERAFPDKETEVAFVKSFDLSRSQLSAVQKAVPLKND